MRFTKVIASIGMVMIFFSCTKDPNSLSATNSESFPENQVQLHFQSGQLSVADSLVNNDRSNLANEQHLVVNQLDEMLAMTKQVQKTASPKTWVDLIKKWTEFNKENFGNRNTPFSYSYSHSDSMKNKQFREEILKWVELNIELVKLSGEVRFGDALEKMVYGPEHVFIPEETIKSVIYTHSFDKVYVNVIGSSSVDYQHTTGGNVRIIQETNYPTGTEMTLKCECKDLRYMDVFIRIPSWAINPTVTHGNVKYVARPGEYCQISKKWKTGDEIRVVLKN